MTITPKPCDQCPGSCNADPTFVFPSQGVTLPSGELARYLSPLISPGIQDTARFAQVFSETAQVTARVVNGEGQEIRRLLTDAALSSTSEVRWDGRDNQGVIVAEGAYRVYVDGRGLKTGTSLSFAGTFVVDDTAPSAEIERIEGLALQGQSVGVAGSALDSYFKQYLLEAVPGT
ncbi:MAG: FlgD immunoglobulin-like domain containing protein, partial [bacterium]